MDFLVKILDNKTPFILLWFSANAERGNYNENYWEGAGKEGRGSAENLLVQNSIP